MGYKVGRKEDLGGVILWKRSFKTLKSSAHPQIITIKLMMGGQKDFNLESKGFCSKFSMIFRFWEKNFFHNCHRKRFQGKIVLMLVLGVHRKCRFVEFALVVKTTVSNCSVSTLLGGAIEVCFFTSTQFSRSQVVHIFEFAVWLLTNTSDAVITAGHCGQPAPLNIWLLLLFQGLS